MCTCSWHSEAHSTQRVAVVVTLAMLDAGGIMLWSFSASIFPVLFWLSLALLQDTPFLCNKFNKCPFYYAYQCPFDSSTWEERFVYALPILIYRCASIAPTNTILHCQRSKGRHVKMPSNYTLKARKTLCCTINSMLLNVRVAQKGRSFRARQRALNHATIRSDFGA